jgi:hypothetical protein
VEKKKSNHTHTPTTLVHTAHGVGVKCKNNGQKEGKRLNRKRQKSKRTERVKSTNQGK